MLKKSAEKDEEQNSKLLNFNNSINSIAFKTTVEEIVRENEFTRITQIHEQLKNKGFKISTRKLRDFLIENRIRKGCNSKGLKVYQIQSNYYMPTFDTKINELVISIVNNQTVIFIKTVSGAASFIAKLIDGVSEKYGILGTIAGDDSVLVIPASTKKLNSIYKNLLLEIGKI